MITHTVSFTLKPDVTSDQESQFFDAARVLGEIPGIRDLLLLRQTSATNPYAFCFSMEFPDEATYRSYSSHPLHDQFVEEQWLMKVDAFQEADFEKVEDWPRA